LQELEELLNSSLISPSIYNEVEILRDIVEITRAWTSKISRTLLEQLEEDKQIKIVKDNLRILEGLPIDLSNMTSKLRRLIPSKRVQTADEARDEQRYCLCRGFYQEDTPMIACDSCQDW